jgi:3-oxoacyl-ACP reductase-like protein
MPLQIDNVETQIEIASSSRASGSGTSSAVPSAQAIAAAVAEERAQTVSSMGTVLASELDRFLKMRGM